VTAQLEMGRMYEKGQGVEVDSTASVLWYRKAAEQGSVHAQNKMGSLYKQGTTTLPRDIEEAMKWYDMAAKQHNPDAQNNYAWLCYIKKENIEKGIQYIKESLEKTPDNIRRLDTYASLLFRQGNYTEAEITEKKALDGGGDKKVGYLEMYGDIQIKLGNKDEAMKYWRMAKEMAGHSDKLDEKLSTENYVE